MKKNSSVAFAAILNGIFVFFRILFEIIILIILVNKFKENSIFIILLMVPLIAFFIISFIITGITLKKNFSKQIVIIKNDFSMYIKLLHSLIEIIIKYNQSLSITLKTVYSTNYVSQKENLEKLIVVNNILEEREKRINELFNNYNVYTLDLVIDEVREFYKTIMDYSQAINDNIKSYNDEVLNLKNINDAVLINSSKLLYTFKIAIPILSDISVASNTYSSGMIKNIFNKFDTVSNYSQNIYKSTQDTINSFMDLKSNDSLAYISEETKNIKNKIDDFFKTMYDLKKASDGFLNNSVNSFKEMENTSSTIEDISEKIKLIAINVRIEASHLSDETGFKVLGKEISEFAEITSKVAKDSYKRIKETFVSIESLKNDYLEKLNDVYDYLSKIKDSFMPFEDIINNSFNKIKLIIEYMDNFSKGINDKIKETVGALQFHDVTMQESEHIIKFIQTLSNLFYHLTKDLNIDEKITELEKTEIARNIIDKLEEITTTENERKVIQKYADEQGVVINENTEELKNVQKLDDQTILF